MRALVVAVALGAWVFFGIIAIGACIVGSRAERQKR